jgi:HSP20 family protein
MEGLAMLPDLTNRNLFPSFLDDWFTDENWPGTDFFKKGVNVPSVNITEDKNAYNIEIAAPGLKKEDFNIDLENNVLTVSAEKEEKDEKKDKRFMRKEFSYTSFKRSFACPESVNPDQINAKYNDGILNISVPKVEEKQKPNKKIKIS